MANPFYTKTFDVTPGNLVRSQTLEDQFLLVEQGFDTVNTNLVTKASPTTTGTGSHTGDYTITGNETVTGGLSVGGSETVTGGMSVGTSLSVGTNLTVGGSETVTGGMSVGGAITAGGKVTAGAGPSTSLDLTTKDYVDSLVTATAFSTSLPLQSGNAGKFVTTNGTSASWAFAGIAQVTTATGSTTLTNTPTLLQITPTAPGVTVTLPNATTCSLGGPLHCIDNRSEFPIRVVNANSILIGFALPRTATFIALDNNSTSAGVWSGQFSKVGWSAGLSLSAAAQFSNWPTCVALDVDRTFLGWSTGSAFYGVVFRQSTNTFSSVTLLRTVASATVCAGVLAATNSVLFVSTTSGTAIQGVVLSINASTDAITVNTPVSFTAAANVSQFGPSGSYVNSMSLVSPPSASGSFVLTFTTSTPQAFILAFSVSGTTTTVGAATALGGTVAPCTIPTADKVVCVSYTTTTGYFNVYTISGTTISTGTGGTVASVASPAQFIAWGSRFLVLWQNSAGTSVTASLLALSGTTLTASTVTGVVGATSVAVDVAPVGSTKMLVVSNNNTPGSANLLTDTAGTLSAGTALTKITGGNQKAIAWVNDSDALVVEGAGKAHILSCSGSSPTYSYQILIPTSAIYPFNYPQFDGRTYFGVVGANYRFDFQGFISSTPMYIAADGYAFQAVNNNALPPFPSTMTAMNNSYRNECWSFATYQIALLECVA